MTDGMNKDDEPGKPLTPAERVAIREIIDQYQHSRWLFLFTMKVAKWVAAIAAGIVAYKQLPGLLK